MDTRIRIGVDDVRGRGVFATRDLPAGVVVVRALPFALVPDDTCMLTHCCACLARVNNPTPCHRCQSAVLCARCAERGAHAHHERCARGPMVGVLTQAAGVSGEVLTRGSVVDEARRVSVVLDGE